MAEVPCAASDENGAVMRIASQDGSAFVTIRCLDRDARGNVHATVRATGAGFAGSNRSVWFEGRAVKRFVADLTTLEQTRQGRASLETMSPDECCVVLRSVDRLGHVHVDVAISRCVFFFGETDWLRCRIRFEIDPTVLPEVLQGLRSELQGEAT